MNAPAYSLETEPDSHVTSSPELAMWQNALALFCDDARRYHQGKGEIFGAVPGTDQRALRDLCERGPMVRHLCEMTGNDVDWLCERFIRSLSLDG